MRSSRSDPVPEHTDLLDLQLHLVARTKPAPVSVLEDAARPDGARPEDVAGQAPRARGCVRGELLEGPVDVAEVASRSLLSVHTGCHLESKVTELLRADQHRTERGGKVLPLRRPEPDGHLGALEIASRPVVQNREAGDAGL